MRHRTRTAALLWWLIKNLIGWALQLEKPEGAAWTCFIHGWLSRTDLDGGMSIPFRHFTWDYK